MVPQPVLAVLLLYPITKESDEANEKGTPGISPCCYMYAGATQLVFVAVIHQTAKKHAHLLRLVILRAAVQLMRSDRQQGRQTAHQASSLTT